LETLEFSVKREEFPPTEPYSNAIEANLLIYSSPKRKKDAKPKEPKTHETLK
jgi:hypothetical protein